MRKVLLVLLIILSRLTSFGQSETHNFVTYDTTIIYFFDPFHSVKYHLRISRPVNLFTAGSSDTASRPWFYSMPGVGEMGTDTTKLYTYGPHALLKSGAWDGSVVLGNGTHYPILVTAICENTQPPAAGTIWIVNYFITHYHCKLGGTHIFGLSEGAFTNGTMLGITDTTGTSMVGADVGMRNIKSATFLSGVASANTGPTPAQYSEFGHWAVKYGGKAFFTVGYADAQSPYPPLAATQMNDSLAGSAYFTYNTVGSGSHCCWNTEYDQTLVLWNSGLTGFTPAGTYVTTSTSPNVQGPYRSPGSLFQNAMRQGDTTLVGTPPLSVKKVIEMEYWPVFWGSNDTLYGTVNGSTFPVAMPLPGGETIRGAYGAFNQVEAVSSAGKFYSSSTYNFGSNTWTQISTDSTNAAITNAINVFCFQNTWIIERADSSLWLGGADYYQLYYNAGTNPVMRPTLLSNAAKFVKVVMGGQYIAATTETGAVYIWAFNSSGSPTRTPLILTESSQPSDIATGAYNSILIIVAGKILAYGNSWGTWGATSAASYSSFTDISSIWSAFPYSKISMTTNATHAITTAGALWGSGYNVQGEVGNGQEFVNRYTYVNWRHYGNTFVDFQNPVAPPQAILPGTQFTDIYDNVFFTFYKYAKDVNGNLYSWGRNKTAVCGNGLFTGFAFNQSDPNLLDITVPTLVTPLTDAQQTINPTLPTAPLTGSQNVTGTSGTITLSGAPVSLVLASNGTKLCCSYTAITYSQLSGPSTVTFGTQNASTTSVNNLITGTYGIHVATTDTKGALDTGYIQLVVSANTPPTVNISGPQTITLPTTTAVISGNCTGNGGATVISSSWTQTGGPIGVTITPGGSAGSPVATITGMTVIGLYTFKLTATDNNSSTNSNTTTVTVISTIPTGPPQLTFPVRMYVKP